MSARPPVFTWNKDLHFGPPSEPVCIRKFLDDAEKLSLCGISPWLNGATSKGDVYNFITGWKDWQELSDETRASVESDCKLDDIKSPLIATLKSQKQGSHLQKLHAAALKELTSQGTRKGKEKDTQKEKENVDEEIEPLKKAIEQTQLKIWRLKHDAKPYIRTCHVSDQNALVTPYLTRREVPHVLSREVLITITAYTRNNWYPYAFTRTCQHVLPSACTLADLWNCISCDLKGDGSMPHELFESSAEDDPLDENGTQTRSRLVGYQFGDSQSDTDSAVIVIEDTAYCDGRGSPDYVDKLFCHLDKFKSPLPGSDAPPQLPLGLYERPKRSTPLQKGLPFHLVPLRSLTLCVNEPYWTLHRGMCEHWFVVDEIRLQNPRDPNSGYPIAIQRTPTSRPLCRICSKVPATMSIINDIRLGESPAFVCRPCWEFFGDPPPLKQDDDINARVIAVPMPAEPF